jgi:hypothetical protein
MTWPERLFFCLYDHPPQLRTKPLVASAAAANVSDGARFLVQTPGVQSQRRLISLAGGHFAPDWASRERGEGEMGFAARSKVLRTQPKDRISNVKTSTGFPTTMRKRRRDGTNHILGGASPRALG